MLSAVPHALGFTSTRGLHRSLGVMDRALGSPALGPGFESNPGHFLLFFFSFLVFTKSKMPRGAAISRTRGRVTSPYT